jgi:phosphoribosylformylglycinamidine synthase
MNLQEISLFETAEQLGLNRRETENILERLGRNPSKTELAMVSVEWSEHCSYRRSRKFFKNFPRSGSVPTLVGEDAGGIIIDDLAIVFKIESHNHPSQIEPKHGAATGVGGIIRDILSCGARPIAVLDSLRFGSLSGLNHKKLFQGVVDGISWYGNSIGVPTIGGETDFHPSYSENCLVNVMCIGTASKNEILTSKAKPGCAVMILGARTGRDGIGGCSILASQEMRAELEKRPTVQIGDPYFGKCLIEATLEAASKGLFVAVKDMGAAGLTCTTSEMSAAGSCGMEIELAKIPAREKNMESYEFMMSESQERMLAVVEFEKTSEVKNIFHKWGLEAEVIGKTIPEEKVKIFYHHSPAAEIPTQLLIEPLPVHPEIKSRPKSPGSQYSIPKIENLKNLFLKFLELPSLISKQWIWNQYDYMVQTNTVVPPGQDAAVLRIKGKPWGIAVALEGNGRYCSKDPFLGSQYLLAEAVRNLACVGVMPLAATDGLNFGNPDKPESYAEFISCLEGLTQGCKILNIPIVSGNVSFYNESPNGKILPTPIIGMIGKCENLAHIVPSGFQNQGDKIYLIGPQGTDLSGSLFLEFMEIQNNSLPELNWEIERKIAQITIELLEAKFLNSCHDLGQGGLITCLCECVVEKGCGAKLEKKLSIEELFNESPSRILVSVSKEKKESFETKLIAEKIPFLYLGETGGDKLSFNQLEFQTNELSKIYFQTLEQIMSF